MYGMPLCILGVSFYRLPLNSNVTRVTKLTKYPDRVFHINSVSYSFEL